MRTLLGSSVLFAVLVHTAGCRAPAAGSSPPARAATGPTLHVLVVDGATKQPVEGAEVEYVRHADWSEDTYGELFVGALDFEANRRKLVTRVRTAADGTAELTDALAAPEAEGLLRVLWRIDARKGGAWGVLDPERVEDGAARIELRPDTSRRFLVRSAGRAVPAGVRVGVGANRAESAAEDEAGDEAAEERVEPDGSAPDDASDDASDASRDEDADEDRDRALFWCGETDADGAVVLPHLAYYARLLPADAETFVVANFDDDQDVLAQRSFELAPGEDVVLELPPSSNLELEVVDARGRAVELGAVEFVCAVTLAEADFEEAGVRVVRGGRVLLPALAPGRGLALRASAPGWCAESVEGTTPSRPAETGHVRIELKRRAATITGRLVDETHRPWAGAAVQLHPLDSDESVLAGWGAESAWTDDQGRFRVEADPARIAAADGRLRLEITMERDPADRSGLTVRSQFGLGVEGSSRPWRTPVTVALADEERTADLGDVVVRRAP